MSLALDDHCKQFLIKLFETTQGDPNAQASSHEIGEAVGLERDGADRITSELMGWELVEIRTLSGGIGITKEGVDAARKFGSVDSDTEASGPVLGNDPILDDNTKIACEGILTRLKANAEAFHFSFEAMNEFLADVNTMLSQLGSPRPKTIIFRESFKAVSALLKSSGATDQATEIDHFLR